MKLSVRTEIDGEEVIDTIDIDDKEIADAVDLDQYLDYVCQDWLTNKFGCSWELTDNEGTPVNINDLTQKLRSERADEQKSDQCFHCEMLDNVIQAVFENEADLCQECASFYRDEDQND